jgi:hypothetical protein
MSRALDVGTTAPPIVLPGVPGEVDTRAWGGLPRVIEFHRGTW